MIHVKTSGHIGLVRALQALCTQHRPEGIMDDGRQLDGGRSVHPRLPAPWPKRAFANTTSRWSWDTCAITDPRRVPSWRRRRG